MDNTLLQKISQLYRISTIQKYELVEKGYLSQNHVLKTADGKFFLKRYNFKHSNDVALVHKAKFFFSSQNVPVILPFETVESHTFFGYQNIFYALFPFIDGINLHRDELNNHAIASMGSMLAKMHLISKNQTPVGFKVRDNGWNPQASFHDSNQLLKQINKILGIITTKNKKDGFDIMAEESLRTKISIITKYQNNPITWSLKSDHLVQGDYHHKNLFFDPQYNVSHIYDFEKSELRSRDLDIIRSMLITCFGGKYDTRAFSMAETYIKAYNDMYPINAENFDEALLFNMLKRGFSLWIENEHYIKYNNRMDDIYPEYVGTANYLAKNFDTFKSTIISYLS